MLGGRGSAFSKKHWPFMPWKESCWGRGGCNSGAQLIMSTKRHLHMFTKYTVLYLGIHFSSVWIATGEIYSNPQVSGCVPYPGEVTSYYLLILLQVWDL